MGNGVDGKWSWLKMELVGNGMIGNLEFIGPGVFGSGVGRKWS